MNDHGLEQLLHFPTREKKKKTSDLILTSLRGQFQDIHSPEKLSDHDIVSGTLKVIIPPIKKHYYWNEVVISLKRNRSHTEALYRFMCFCISILNVTNSLL